jgi:hypothetical protein
MNQSATPSNRPSAPVTDGTMVGIDPADSNGVVPTAPNDLYQYRRASALVSMISTDLGLVVKGRGTRWKQCNNLLALPST